MRILFERARRLAPEAKAPEAIAAIFAAAVLAAAALPAAALPAGAHSNPLAPQQPRFEDDPPPFAVLAAAPTAPTERQLKLRHRFVRDLDRIIVNGSAEPHAFAGKVRVQSGGIDTMECAFGGGLTAHQGVAGSWFEVPCFRSHTVGTRTIFSFKNQAWEAEHGDEPEVPLSPTYLLPHLRHAAVGTPQPDSFDGRPAMRVHCQFTGRASKNVLYAAAVPMAQYDRMVESQAIQASRSPASYVVDLSLLYDPATQRWLTATLRLAWLDGTPIEPSDPPRPTPRGLPKLSEGVNMEAIWSIRRMPPKGTSQSRSPRHDSLDFESADSGMEPELDASARRLLRIEQPAKQAPSAKKKPSAAH
ncbi:MAG: hypothetical protein AB8H80_07840 [Planctomycetota bacterium]